MKFFTDFLFKKEIWQVIPDLKIHWKPAPYGVINERAIRATAWIMFTLGLITFFIVFSTKNFTLLYPTLAAFWIQFFITVFFWPQYAPFSIIGRWIVSKQQPEYVWAIQKRFAWGIGLVMATTMFLVTAVWGITGMIPMSICLVCLSFMWLESAAGICVWCKIYGWLLSKGYIQTPEHKPACPGWACSLDFSQKK